MLMADFLLPPLFPGSTIHHTKSRLRLGTPAKPRASGREEAAMGAFTREECLRRLRAQVAAGRPILGGGAGIGLSAKCAEAGGIDLIIIYNSGRFRMAGRGSLSG